MSLPARVSCHSLAHLWDTDIDHQTGTKASIAPLRQEAQIEIEIEIAEGQVSY